MSDNEGARRLREHFERTGETLQAFADRYETTKGYVSKLKNAQTVPGESPIGERLRATWAHEGLIPADAWERPPQRTRGRGGPPPAAGADGAPRTSGGPLAAESPARQSSAEDAAPRHLDPHDIAQREIRRWSDDLDRLRASRAPLREVEKASNNLGRWVQRLDKLNATRSGFLKSAEWKRLEGEIVEAVRPLGSEALLAVGERLQRLEEAADGA